VVRLVTECRAERGGSFGLDADRLEALYRQLPDGTLRVYTCRREGRLLGGELTLEFGDTVYGWLGSAARGTELPVNRLLYGHLLRDACRRGYREYDMVGTDDRRPTSDQATFDPELRGYAVLARRTVAGRLARRLYRLTG
jgi:CelD/BcsL family acetyltransferase involved in cellulose biosynthesis